MFKLKNTHGKRSRIAELRHQSSESKHIFLHISEVSAVMVGICQAGVGLIHIATVIKKVDTYIDDLLALDSLVFTTSCITAFLAIRTSSIRKSLKIGYVSESFFLIGLCLMAVVSLLTAYSSIKP